MTKRATDRYNTRVVLVMNEITSRKMVLTTKNFRTTKERFFSMCRTGQMENEEILKDFKAHGKSSFVFTVLQHSGNMDVIESIVEALERLFHLCGEFYGDFHTSTSTTEYYIRSDMGRVMKFNDVKETALQNGFLEGQLYALLRGDIDILDGFVASDRDEWESQR